MAHKRGFTLIELLVVIAVIGILASSVIIGLSRAQTRARDASRKSDLDQMRKALETYLIDNPSGYPSAGANQGTIADLSTLASDTKFAIVMDGVAIPADPRNIDGVDWHYKYINNYTGSKTAWEADATGTAKDVYTVYAHLESPKTSPVTAGKAIWWHVNSKGASMEVEMAATGASF